MTQLKIKRFSSKSLRVEEDFGFLKQVQAEAKANLPGSGSDNPEELRTLTASASTTVLTASLEAFDSAIEGFDTALKESTSLPSSSIAANADAERDQAWRGCNAYLKAMNAHPDESVSAAAIEAKALFDKYGDPTSLSQTEESGVLHNLTQDLKAIPSEKRTALALDVWITQLEAKEQAFLTAARQRDDEQSARVTGIVKQSRQQADNAYDSLVETVNALVLLEGEAEYATFIEHVNVLIDRQKTVLKTRSTRNAKKEEEGTDNPEEI